MDSYCVYVHTAPNGKKYVGITKQTPENRWKNGAGYLSSPHFWSAIKKYGWDNISHEVVRDGLNEASACEEEKRLIALYRSNEREFGYNQTSGGDAGKRYTDDVRKILSEKARERYESPEEREKASFRVLGTKRSDETRRKISIAKTGKPHFISDETRLKISTSNKAKYKEMPVEQRAVVAERARLVGKESSRKVWQFTKEGEFVALYESLREAERCTGVRNGNISRCCNGAVKTAGGFKWQYAT